MKATLLVTSGCEDLAAVALDRMFEAACLIVFLTALGLIGYSLL